MFLLAKKEDNKMEEERETLLSELYNIVKDFTKEQIDALRVIIEEDIRQKAQRKKLEL